MNKKAKKPSKIALELAKRLKSLLKERDITANYLANKIGKPTQSIYNVLAGRVERPSFLLEIANFFGKDYEWLATGRARASIAVIFGKNKREVPDDSNISIFSNAIPEITWEEAGNPIRRASDIKNKTRKHVVISSCNQECFALIVSGNSMTSFDGSESFTQDTVLIFDPLLKPYLGAYVLARKKDAKAAIFRQLIDDQGTYYLSPLNIKRFPPIQLDKSIDIIAVLTEFHKEMQEPKYNLSTMLKIKMKSNKLKDTLNNK